MEVKKLAERYSTFNTFVLKQIIENKLPVEQETHLLLINLAKAYGNVPLKLHWKTFQP